MKKWAFLLFQLTFSVNVAYAASTQVSKVYLLKIKEQAEKFAKINAELKSNPDSICPGPAQPSRMACMNIFIQRFVIETSIDPTMLSTLVVSEAMKDKPKYSPQVLLVLMTENLLTVFEKVKISTLWLSQFVAMTNVEKLELKQLQKDDEALFETAKTKILSLVTKKMTEIKSTKKLSKDDKKWVDDKIVDFEVRLQKIKNMKLKY